MEQFASALLLIQSHRSWKSVSWTILQYVVCRNHHLSVLKGTFLIAECWNETLTFISAPKGKGFIWVSKDQPPISLATACLKVHFNSWWFHWKIKLTHTSIKQISSPLRILTPFWTLLGTEKPIATQLPCLVHFEYNHLQKVVFCAVIDFFLLSSVYTFKCPY